MTVPCTSAGRSFVVLLITVLAVGLLAASCATQRDAGSNTRLTAVEAPSAPHEAAGGSRLADAVDLEAETELFRSPTLGAFARRNLPTFKRYTLSNGIPFIFKANPANQMFALRIIIRGHTLFTPPAKAGIEAITLSMLAKGSRSYPYPEVERLLYERSAWMSPTYGSPDATSFGLTTLSKYLPELFGVFADSFLHPRWDPAQFDSVLNDFKVAQKREENDPSALNGTALEKRLFAGHPYYALPSGVDNSLANVTLQDVIEYYSKLAVAGRLFIVAAGDFDPHRLFSMLDATFGSLPAGNISVGTPPPLDVRPGLTSVPFSESAGLAYLLGAFELPPPASHDYAALVLALAMLDDILYDNVRTQHGAAYGVSAGAAGVAANYGTISVYKTSEPGKVKPLVDDSISVLASGRAIAARVDASAAGKSGIGGTDAEAGKHAPYVPIADVLQFYRDQYVAGFYAGQETNRSIAAQIAGSAIYRGDYRDYLLTMERLSAVTPDAILSAVHRYLLGTPTLWVAVGPPELLATMDGHRYERLPSGDYDRAAK